MTGRPIEIIIHNEINKKTGIPRTISENDNKKSKSLLIIEYIICLIL